MLEVKLYIYAFKEITLQCIHKVGFEVKTTTKTIICILCIKTEILDQEKNH